jgi:hypothetical protein
VGITAGSREVPGRQGLILLLLLLLLLLIIIIIIWTQWVHTDGEVTANRPDMIIKNKREKTCILMDEAVPADRNFTQKEQIGN